ncbi:YcgJ family protein [Photobacterium sp.]|uniref:YcgJ family protein n=1 Tax=Photobacterium sp. TaxID=660 RepID=UPI00299D3080|nr:YcgJ family protein [Photobacterium sp.]MDX1300867.1 YcgJ family protein [Photobacterium sp.]
MYPFLSGLALSVVLSAPWASTELARNIYSPESGIICDKSAGFCVDTFGISMAFTQQYLGDEAQAAMMKKINRVGSRNFDATRYIFSNGVYCDSFQRACFISRFTDEKHVTFTNILFK